MCQPDHRHGGEATTPSGQPGPAWQAAIDAGLDMSLVELSLSKTPWERMQDHDQALAFAEMLREAGRAHNAPA